MFILSTWEGGAGRSLPGQLGLHKSQTLQGYTVKSALKKTKTRPEGLNYHEMGKKESLKNGKYSSAWCSLSQNFNKFKASHGYKVFEAVLDKS